MIGVEKAEPAQSVLLLSIRDGMTPSNDIHNMEMT